MRALIRWSPLAVLLLILAVSVDAQTPASPGPQLPPQTQARPGVPQAPARDTKAPKAPTALIRGRVTAADNLAPLRRAHVVLSAAGAQKSYSATTDNQGRYEFNELPAGRYTLVASKSSYVTLQYGQRRAFESGKPIDLADGATLDKIDFALPRGGVISGTITDDLGEPVAGVRVTAMRSRYQEGKRKLLPIGRTAETNDLGQYRLYGLEPGAYFVATLPSAGIAAALGQPPAMAAATLEQGFQFPPSYFPGTLNAAEAQRVNVRIGQERGAADFAQLPGRLATISGSVLDSQGRVQAPAMVMLLSTSSIGSALLGTVNADGTFKVSNVAPGEYGLGVTVRDTASGETQTAALQLTVAGDDISNLVIPMSPGARLIGRVTGEDGNPPPIPVSGVRILPVAVESDLPLRMGGGVAAYGTVNEDWTFDWKGMGGRLLFRPRGLPAGFMLKSVLLDGRDITDLPIDVKGTEEVSGLQIVLTPRATEINGGVTDAKRQPVTEYAVVVFAEDSARLKYPSRFIGTARPDAQGHYKIANLPAGSYLAVALGYLEEGQSEDPDYLETLRGLATRFTLAEGETKTLDLKVTKPEGGQ
jgi:hypothetical protein